jgi:hypothetical protein
MRVDGVSELDRDLNEGEADEQAENRKQEFEIAHCPAPCHTLAGRMRIPK